MTGTHHHAQLFDIETGSRQHFVWNVLKLQSSAFGWDGGLSNFLAAAGLKLPSSPSQPHKYLGLQAWATGAQCICLSLFLNPCLTGFGTKQLDFGKIICSILSLPLWTPEASSIHSSVQLPLPALAHTWSKEHPCVQGRMGKDGRRNQPLLLSLRKQARPEEATTDVCPQASVFLNNSNLHTTHTCKCLTTWFTCWSSSSKWPWACLAQPCLVCSVSLLCQGHLRLTLQGIEWLSQDTIPIREMWALWAARNTRLPRRLRVQRRAASRSQGWAKWSWSPNLLLVLVRWGCLCLTPLSFEKVPAWVDEWEQAVSCL
jgi:hypothetical protein